MSRDEDKIQRWADRKLDEHLEGSEPEEVFPECGCTAPYEDWETDEDGENYKYPDCEETIPFESLVEQGEYDGYSGPDPDEIAEDRQDRFEAEHDY